MYKRSQPGLFQPDKDAGWGLIYRLNGLWNKVDWKVESGDLIGWEIILDRIFANLSYRNEPFVIEDEEGNIIDVKISDRDAKIHKRVKDQITQVKNQLLNAQIHKDANLIKKYHADHYNILMFYDIWLRKFMQSLKLYLRETESNPGRSMWGG